MEYCPLIKCKSWLYWPLMLMMIHVLMVWQTQGDCIEEERKALLEIKASYIKTYDSKIDHFLPTWVDYGNSAPKNGGGDCCDWERISCNTTTGHVMELSLNRLRGVDVYRGHDSKLWPLNVSLFLHFRELTSLNLTFNFLEKESMKTGHAILAISCHYLSTDFDPLRILRHGSPCQQLFSFAGLERLSSLKKLEVLDLSSNYDIGNDILPSLRVLTSLKILDLSGTSLNGNFPANELFHLTNLELLDLSFNQLNDTPNIQACKSLLKLRSLESINLSRNNFNKSIISCLSALPSLKILHLSHCRSLGRSFPVQEFLNLYDLEVLILSYNGFIGALPMEAFTSFHHLRVLDLSHNNFVGSIPSAIHALSSLEVVSFSYNQLNGSLNDHGLCKLKNIHELDLSDNMLHGTLPHCLENLSSLKLLDISLNRFTGIIVPSIIANLTSLEYIDFSHNKFEGSFSFSFFSNHANLEVVRLGSDNDKFEVETEEPIGWIPFFQLKTLVLPNCNINRLKGRVVPGFLLHQHKLQQLDMSHNSLEGHFPNWLIKNNTYLEVLILRNNSLIGSMLLYWNANMKRLDVSANQMIGSIPDDVPKLFPDLSYLNLSNNVLSGAIPSPFGDMSTLYILDLSDNELSGEVTLGLFTNMSDLTMLNLSKNKLCGEVLAGNLSFTRISTLYLDSNHFTGTIGIQNFEDLTTLDISNNFFTGTIPDSIGNMSWWYELVMKNNGFEGQFPCGKASFSFLDISQNSFSGPIPSCLNFQPLEHLYLGSNRFTGSVPNSFSNLTYVLTLDLGKNNLTGRIPEFIGELSHLRILIMRKNNLNGFIPKKLCQLSKARLIDISENSLSGSIPSCLQNIIGPTYLVFLQREMYAFYIPSTYKYESVLKMRDLTDPMIRTFGTRDEVQFTTKSMSWHYKGDILDYMSGLDLSCNKLTGAIPEELGLMTQIRALNLSHNQLTGPIPVNFSNLVNLESLDLSSNGLSGKVPSELSRLNFLSTFNVSHNNLSGRLPDMKAQFSTFTNASYEGNTLLCGPPLEMKCTTDPHITDPSLEEEEGTEQWYYVDMVWFYGSASSTCVLFLLGFVALLYVNPHWRKRWLELVEECVHKCCHFRYDSVMKLYMIFHK